MKIDFYISSLSDGGAQKVLITIASWLAAKGHETAIISLEKKPRFYPVLENVALIRFCSRGKLAFVKDYVEVKRCLKSRKADVSISFLSRCNWLVLLGSLFGREKVVVCDRNNPLREHSRLAFVISSLLYLRANRIVVQTCQIQSFYWKILQPKIRVIENCMDTKALDDQITGPVKREKMILAMGRLEEQKDFGTLIRAFDRISRKYPDWKVEIYGQGTMKKKLQKEIRALGLEQQVFLRGRTGRPYARMCRASIFVLSSRYEGFPNVLCEAMYSGALCISSSCISGPQELIQHGKNGWLFPVGDDAGLARLLDAAITAGEKSSGIRSQARKSVERLCLEKIMVMWEQLIQEF